MKLSILAFLFAFPAHAGLPSEDPEVARLQAEFAAAATPSPEQLAPGRIWGCAGFNAVKGRMERFPGSDYQFQEVKGADGATAYYLELFAYEMVKNHQLDANEVSWQYRYGSGHFMGNPWEDPSIATVHTYLRATADGRLLVEVATYLPPFLPPEVIEKRMQLSAPATLYPELRLMGYDECRLKEAP